MSYWGLFKVQAMSNYMPDSPWLARHYCPTCEPTADPITEILEVRWCGAHDPNKEGLDDRLVEQSGVYISGSTEAGEDNRAICDFIHRRKGA